MSAQLELFLPNDDISLLWRELAAGREYTTRSNRALFAKLHEFGKMIIEMQRQKDEEIIRLRDEIDRLRGMLVK